jgi:hypothetical protein
MKLCFSLWHLKFCRKSNDKSVYSKFQVLSLVGFEKNISVTLLHVNNIGSVLNTLFTLRSSPFITALAVAVHVVLFAAVMGVH